MKDPRYPFALDLGTEIGGYLIDQVLGAGGFGITYRGYNEITQKRVAIKEFYVRDISNREGATVVVDQDVEHGTYEYALKKFQDEAQAVVTRFQHPYIIRGENFIRAHNTCYLVMDYIEGSNLDDWLNARASPLNEADLRPFFEKLFEAVDYVHQHNMMHRDLTPRNIMVRPDGDPVLIDFGAAGLGIDLGRSSKIVAQLRYAPPEQSDDTASSVHGRYTDIFSLAGVLFRCVTGKTPMAPTSRLTRISQHRDQADADPQAPVATLVANKDGYSPTFLAGIDRGLQLDERLRPQSISEFKVALGWATPDEVAAAKIADADAETAILVPATRPITAAFLSGAPLTGAAFATPGLTSVDDVDATRALARPPDRAGEASSADPGTEPTPPPVPASVSLTASFAQTLSVSATQVTAANPLPPFLASATSKPRTKWRWLGAVGVVLAAGVVAAAVFNAPIRAEFDDLFGPPTISPYRFSAIFDGPKLALVGYVPNQGAHDHVVAALAKALPGSSLEDHLSLGRGAPDNLLSAVDAFASHIPQMARGSLELVANAVHIEAAAATPAAYSPLKSEFGLLTTATKGQLLLQPAHVAPYVFSLAVSGAASTPVAVVTGFEPGEEARRKISTALKNALPGVRIEDRTQLALGAPFDLAEAIAAVGARLKLMDHATLTLVERGLRLEGAPRDPAQSGLVSAPFDPAALPANVSVELSIAPLVVSPYVFTATVKEGTLTLAGYVPDAAIHQQVKAMLGPQIAVVDRLAVAGGAPENAVEAIQFAVNEAQLLATGSVSITDRTIDIVGTIRRVADVGELRAAFNRRRPRGFSIDQASYGLREDVPVDDCDRLALPPDQSDRPAGVSGIALDGINPALAVPACRKAVETYPNVRRFVTALGAALQRDGKAAEALANYRLAADADDASAIAHLGEMIRRGEGGPSDPVLAAELIEKARKLDNAYALYATAQSYERGDLGHGRDMAEAIKICIRAANRGSAEADFRLGTLAQAGSLNGRPDPEAAYGYFQKAAELGLPLAMHRYASANQLGQTPGHIRDFHKAFEWYLRAADAGRAESMAALGNLYLQGLGVVADPARAREWLEKAANAGDSNAMLQLGRLEFEGQGGSRDLTAAAAWFEKAAAAGRPESYARLGALYQAATQDGSKPDYAQAYAWNEKGAALNDAQSFLQLGMLYRDGLGRPVDTQKAEENFQRAGDLGNARGYYEIAVMAERGRGRPIDFVRATTFYQRAANLSYTPAMVRYGLLAMNGSGTQKDDAAALLSFTKALQLGDAEGLWYAAVMTDAGRGGPRNPDRVATYLLDALQRHETHAVSAISGDMAAFSIETRMALQHQLQARGLLKATALDGIYDDATRDAALASARPGTD